MLEEGEGEGGGREIRTRREEAFRSFFLLKEHMRTGRAHHVV
jgi:hypothetical protein